MPHICRDCLSDLPVVARCPSCGSRRVIGHAELEDLSIAHVDCDAFYASVEKRDTPDYRDQPLIVGGGTRGVVATCCYIARLYGVRSAMPMFEALKRCPQAVVVAPRMAAYAEASRAIRDKFEALTPLVQPLSLDEAFLDLTGTRRLHGMAPAKQLMKLAREVEEEIGITFSVGLSHNKFLAKIASDLDKPRGFSVIGRAETMAFLRDKPVRLLWGVGLASQAALERAGIRTLTDLQAWDLPDLVTRFGHMGERLYHLARGEDIRKVAPQAPAKSISKETTFSEDIADLDLLLEHLWRLSEEASARAKSKCLAGRSVTLKLKRADHRILTRTRALAQPTQIADTIWSVAKAMLQEVTSEAPFRLIGIGLADLSAAQQGDASGDLLDPLAEQRAKVERVSDHIRDRFGKAAIQKGRGFR